MPSSFARRMQYSTYCTGREMYFRKRTYKREKCFAARPGGLFLDPIFEFEARKLLDVQVPP
jgi:hypothetical protein